MINKINKKLIESLSSKNNQIVKAAINEILLFKKITNKELNIILTNTQKLYTTDFVYNYKYFSDQNILELERFVNANLTNRNKLFVSDLIEIAIDFNLDIPYRKCLLFLNKYKKDHHFVLIASIEYLFTNLKTIHFVKIEDKLNFIIKNKEHHIVAKIVSAFYLYRFTQKEIYYKKLVHLIEEDNYYKILLSNLLKKEFNQRKFFNGYDLLKTLAKK